MAQQRRQHGERVEVGDTFDSFAVTQPEPVDVGPLEPVVSDGGAQPELDEDNVVIASPVIDVGSQAGKAAKEWWNWASAALMPTVGGASGCTRTTSECSRCGSRWGEGWRQKSANLATNYPAWDRVFMSTTMPLQDCRVDPSHCHPLPTRRPRRVYPTSAPVWRVAPPQRRIRHHGSPQFSTPTGRPHAVVRGASR